MLLRPDPLDHLVAVPEVVGPSAWARRMAGAAALLAGALGAFTLLGWLLDWPWAKSLVPGRFAMQPWTALALLSGALSLHAAAVAATGRRAGGTPPPRIVAAAAAGGVLLAGGLALIQHATGLDLGTDRWFFPEAVVTRQTSPYAEPGRMGPATAAGFLLLGAALLAVRAPQASGGALVFVASTTAVCVIALFTLAGYLYGVPTLTGLGFAPRVAVHTALGLLALGLGLLALRPDLSSLRHLAGPGPGATLARRLLPAVLGVPVALALLFDLGVETGLYDAEIRLALVALGSVAVLLAVLVAAAARLDREASGRAELAATLDLTAALVRDPDGTIRHWSAGCERLYGIPAAAAVGRISHGLLGTEFPAPLPVIEAALRRDGEWHGELVHHLPDGRRLTVASHWVLRRNGATGRPEAVVEANTDVTARVAAEAALRESEASLARVQRIARVGSWIWSIEQDHATVSPIYAALFGRAPDAPPPGRADWLACIHPEDRARVAAELELVLAGAGGDTYESEYRVVHPDGSVHWLVSKGELERDPATGAPRRMLGAVYDVTALREAQARRELLLREVDHRAKNALAVVQAVLRLTPAEDPKAYRAAVEGRVRALAQAQALLARGRWEGGSLRAVLEAELAPFLDTRVESGAGPGEPRVTLEGPPVALGPAAVQAVAMVAHELATNATKHGALSAPAGRIAVTWRRDEAARAEAATAEATLPRLHLRWEERGGPTLSGPPTRSGFGSTLLAAVVRDQLGGSLTLRWETTGLVCDLDLSDDRLQGETSSPAPPPAVGAGEARHQRGPAAMA